MTIRKTILIAVLLLCPAMTSSASEPITIPVEIAKNLKKGKKLDQVWAAPGFDGTKGFRLGALTNNSEESAPALMEFIPVALRSLIQGDSPYTLHFAVVSARFKSGNNGFASARIEVEGRLVDKAGAIVAAFTAHATDTTGGSETNNSRTAMREIAFAMTKDLFTSALPVEQKSPAVMVPAPSAPPTVQKTPTVLVPAPSLPPAASPAPSKAAVPAPAPALAPAPATAAQPKASPVVPQPELAPALFPPAVAADMKQGAGLWKVWVSPSYSKAAGFALGEVRYQVEARNDGIDKYLPEALAKIAKPDAPCVLELRITELSFRVLSKGASTARLGVQGRLVAKDGTLVAAFETRETVRGIGDSIDDCMWAARGVVVAIGKDLL